MLEEHLYSRSRPDQSRARGPRFARLFILLDVLIARHLSVRCEMHFFYIHVIRIFL